MRLSQLSAEVPKIAAVTERAQIFMEQDDVEDECQSIECRRDVVVIPGSSEREDRAHSASPSAPAAPKQFDKEGEKSLLRGKATEDVSGSAQAPLGPGPSCIERSGPSTTLAKVGLTNSFVGRKEGGRPPLSSKERASSPPEFYEREEDRSL
jgi:hypothetical protein